MPSVAEFASFGRLSEDEEAAQPDDEAVEAHSMADERHAVRYADGVTLIRSATSTTGGCFATALEVEAAVAYAKFMAGEGQQPAEAPVPAPATAPEPEVQEEVDGVKLWLSARSNNSTGYKGVNKKTCPKSAAKPFVAQGPQPEKMHIGYYATAVQAAVAYAKFMAGEEPPAPQPKGHETMVKEVDGVKLFLSTRSITGYRGIFKKSDVATKPFEARGPGDKYLGCFATAVEAAVAYAKHVGGGAAAAKRRGEEASRPTKRRKQNGWPSAAADEDSEESEADEESEEEESEEEESEEDDLLPPQQPSGMAAVHAALTALGLAQHADAFADAGYTDLRALKSLGLEERLEVGMQAGMVRGLAMRFALQL